MKRFSLLAVLLVSGFLAACQNEPEPPPPIHRHGGFNADRDRDRDRPSAQTSDDDSAPAPHSHTAASDSGDSDNGSSKPEPQHPDGAADGGPASSAPPPIKVTGDDYGKPVQGRPGFVTSPYAPNAGFVDVRGYPPGTPVKDPYAPGKTFLVP